MLIGNSGQTMLALNSSAFIRNFRVYYVLVSTTVYDASKQKLVKNAG